MDIDQRTRVKFNQTLEKYQPFLTLPEYKFFRQMSYGILANRHVHLNKIGSNLQEEITLKKTTERLSRNLGKPALSDKLTLAHLRVNRRAARKCEYLIFDISDIAKAYAQAMEGLARVHDGSKDEIANGYWLANVIAVDKTAERIIPLYSEFYSLDHIDERESSENKKILKAINTVSNELKKSQIAVIDRGGDRRKLIEKFLNRKQYFIIPQTGRRDLHTGKRRVLLKLLSKKIKRGYVITVTKRRHGKVLEKICLRRYTALKNFVTLFWVVMSLIYHHFAMISIKIFTGVGIKVTYREKLREYIGFIYYKMARAIAWLFTKCKLVTSVKFPSCPRQRQLTLEF